MASDISFDDNNKFNRRPGIVSDSQKKPGIIYFLIHKGIVKDEKKAGYFLMSLSILFFIISAYIFLFFVFDVLVFQKDKQSIPEGMLTGKERFEQIRQQKGINIQNNQ